MANKQSITQSLKERLAELKKEATQLEKALSALEPEGKAPRQPASPGASGKPRGRPKKSADANGAGTVAQGANQSSDLTSS